MKKFKTQEIRDLFNQVMHEEISFSRMVEVINEMVSESEVINNAVLPRDIDMRCPYCKSENIVWYGLSGDCVCNKCGEEGSIIV